MTGPVEHKPLELDASDLTYEEWFFLWTAFGQKPDASMKDAAEWRKRSLGMTRAQQMVTMRLGLESLLQRGFIVQERDANGSLVYDQTGQPVYKGVGRIVSRIRSVQPIVGQS